jgi:hypothetical protein
MGLRRLGSKTLGELRLSEGFGLRSNREWHGRGLEAGSTRKELAGQTGSRLPQQRERLED